MFKLGKIILFVNGLIHEMCSKIPNSSLHVSYAQMPHVLVVDDDERICSLVSRYLSEHDFLVLEAHNALEARAFLKSFEFDVIVLDVMMPGESGLELTKFVQECYNTPVILLTALGEIDDRISGLRAGADDYLPKPFEPKELVLRLQAILRRSAKPVAVDLPCFKIGRWAFDPKRDELRDGDDILQLTATELALIRALAGRGGQVMSRKELAELCGLEAGERTVDVQVTRLRRKIEEDTKAPRYLQTVRGKGYLLRIEEVGSNS